MSDTDDKKIIGMPLIALRGLVMFPGNVLSFEVGRSKSVEAMEKASENGRLVFLAAQKEPQSENPQSTEIYTFGTISEIKKIIPIGDSVRVIAQGKTKGRVREYMVNTEYFEVNVEVMEAVWQGGIEKEDEALMESVKEAFSQYAFNNPRILKEITDFISKCDSPIELADLIASNISVKFDRKQKILEIDDYRLKLSELLALIYEQTEFLKIQKDINDKVKKNVDQSQREYYLKEQSKVINEELGDKTGVAGDVEGYKERMEKLSLPEYVTEKLERELKRLQKSGSHAQEGVVIRDYIEWVLDIPWSEKSEENPSLSIAKDILNEDHYGLKEVKQRIIEFLAVKQNTKSLNAPILCLVGPPGVGKTSVAKSIARALGREYVRMSLGGVRDEAEIRGHRRTYVGALPGRIISSMKQAKTTNPVILLDEIDKLSSDYKGDPSSALLEVLDGEQNNTFRDHYIEMPYDLSDVFFICTANTTQTIPAALFDRLELIELSTYTPVEKEQIALDFLIKKQSEKHGIQPGVMTIEEGCIPLIIEKYTKEAGVRQLERQISKICRKVVTSILMDGLENVTIKPQDIEKYLGAAKFKSSKPETGDMPGVAIGLAWTKFGGDTLVIEVNTFKGRGKFEFTGKVGDVMKESALAAISYIRANAENLGIDPDFYRKKDIHIHIPEGAVPKDGPSAGISMCTALISALAEVRVCDNLAMTGEVTMRGNVLAVGGLKEKILAAKNAEITTVLLPFANEGDIADIDDYVKENMNIILVKTMNEVVEHSFGNKLKKEVQI